MSSVWNSFFHQCFVPLKRKKNVNRCALGSFCARWTFSKRKSNYEQHYYEKGNIVSCINHNTAIAESHNCNENAVHSAFAGVFIWNVCNTCSHLIRWHSERCASTTIFPINDFIRLTLFLRVVHRWRLINEDKIVSHFTGCDRCMNSDSQWKNTTKQQ